ncbi:hypothetical protein TUN199_07155 [Pyrenophora tritici-repentis]|uniref:Rhodopsin domain-containing protein n=3 Tax=Pyrenophora tritici-repentis TaxID=45151 RepID=A0A2W1FNE6_9PLEO|nr:hypothetical protein PtrV1_11775 [Pyrenophora tritici-repentis]KAF7444571.1 hypothetical protein A1F99_111240 [Pyrenophora tritici-repentis]KAI0574288.1 hypothetical protein Alg215_08683 [Pyrenophora tritici-repentis]KAI0585004.1 hypothetical protein Alg130_04940 [Pyrenophora tritici-repentis]KAI0610832.1 hypothetical protein TUN205_04920 [Pyrenophora tritici-repentis]
MAGTGLQPANIFLIIFPFLLSFTIVTIRIWQRIKERKYAIEDMLLIIAEAIVLVLTATLWKFVMVSYAGYHAEDIPKGAVQREDVAFWRHTNGITYNPILGFVKISFLITLLKLRCMDRLIIASLWTLIVVNILFIISAVLGSLLICWPIQKSWHSDTPGRCGDRAAYVFGTIAVTIATDVLVAIIPAWVLHDLRMPLRHKMAVIIFLSLPLAATGIGCYRLHKFVEVVNLPKIYGEDPYNVQSVLSNVEANLGVIAACGPTVKWILSRFIPYFDTSPPPREDTPKVMSCWQRRPKAHLKSDGDIELQLNELNTTYPRDASNMCWDNDDDKSGSEKQCETVDSIGKTTGVHWDHIEAPKPSLQLSIREIK